jgi:hypothetical protein
MKRKLALSFLFVFALALTTPVVSEAMNQEPQKTETKTCEEKKTPCCEKKKACGEKKACDKKEEKKEAK